MPTSDRHDLSELGGLPATPSGDQAGGPEKADDGDEDSNVSGRDNVSGRSDDVSTGTSGSNVL